MMVFATFIGILILYFVPLALFIVAAVQSKKFNIKSDLVPILVGMSQQAGRGRDIIATIAVPILALFNIRLDRAAPFDAQVLALALIFLGFAVISLISYGICYAYRERLADYGSEHPAILLGLMENYSRETVIYFAVMLGVSTGPAFQGIHG